MLKRKSQNMPQISFKKNRAPIQVPTGANLMEALLKERLPVASSCFGKGVCSKCRVEICAGEKNLSAESEHEKSLKVRNKIAEDHRVSCQCLVLGDITIDTRYW